MDSVAGIQFHPQFYVDISGSFETKAEALLCHKSQDQWLKSIFNQSITDLIRIQSAFRGMQVGVPYAEAFLSPTYWPKQAISLPFLSR